ncbi:MAG TPA: DNA repair protein RecO [Hyphomicrobiales bacterium]|nr:DNA repair protein RecO [Hyphomicrobiales bacterium]
MRWADTGIFLVGRPYGETSVIADIFTREHGRNPGLVKGGRSRRIRPILQTGNSLKVEWRARLDDQLGVYTVELNDATVARVLDDDLSLAGIASLASLLQVLPERDPHPRLFDDAMTCLEAAGDKAFAASIVRLELRFLDELGFGLDLSECVATGRQDELVYVSPKSGRAVTREAGQPYCNKLLPLPGFLTQNSPHDNPSPDEIVQAMILTGHFLSGHVFSETGKPMPRARETFFRLVRQRAL